MKTSTYRLFSPRTSSSRFALPTGSKASQLRSFVNLPSQGVLGGGYFADCRNRYPYRARSWRSCRLCLLAAESYLPAYKFCGFQPVIAFRFWRGPDAIDVLICFKCSELAFEKVGTQSNLGRKIP